MADVKITLKKKLDRQQERSDCYRPLTWSSQNRQCNSSAE